MSETSRNRVGRSLGAFRDAGKAETSRNSVGRSLGAFRDVGDIPESGPINSEQARVAAFNEWTQFITEIGQSKPVGFVPLFNGTLVGIIDS